VARRSFWALRHPGFRAFFFGTAAAMMADNIEHVVSYWVMYQKFHSPELGGFAVISHWLPFLLFSAYAGALADRFDRRRLIQLGMGLFMAVSVTWGFLFATDTLTPTYAKALLVTHGIAGVLWNPTSQLLLHDIVEPEQLPSAVRLNATARYLGVFFGPAVGSGLLLVLGPSRAIFVNALIYLPLTLWLWRAPYGPRSRTRTPARAAVHGYRDVIATVRAIGADQTIVLMTALAGAASLFVGQAYQAQMPGFASDLGHGNPGFAYWALLSADAGGAVLGALILESRGLLQPRARTALVLALLWCGALGGFALSGSYALALALLFAAGFLELSFNAIAQTLVQLNAPAARRGPIIGVFSMASLGLRMFSGITVGILGGLIGIHLSLAASTAALAVFLLGLLVWHAHLTSPARVGSGV
jgi:MFS family permease